MTDSLQRSGAAPEPTEPIVERGAAAAWPAAAWTFTSLAERAGEAVVPIHTGRWKPSAWGVTRDGPTERRRARSYLNELAEGRPQRPQGYLAGAELLRAVPSLRADLGFPDVGLFAADVIWIGPAGTATPVHYDLATNLYAQLVGRKRWRLWRPERALKPRFGGLGGFAMSQLDAGRGPQSAGEPDQDLILDPGDVLILPRGWWHRVDTLTDAIAVNRWWRFPTLGRFLNRALRRNRTERANE